MAFQPTQLFGGAITVDLPMGFGDVRSSNIPSTTTTYIKLTHTAPSAKFPTIKKFTLIAVASQASSSISPSAWKMWRQTKKR